MRTRDRGLVMLIVSAVATALISASPHTWAAEPAQLRLAQDRTTSPAHHAAEADCPVDCQDSATRRWPQTPTLTEALNKLDDIEWAADWAAAVRQSLVGLWNVPQLEHPDSVYWLERLHGLCRQAEQFLSQQASGRDQPHSRLAREHVLVSQCVFALRRRVDIWTAALPLLERTQHLTVHQRGEMQRVAMLAENAVRRLPVDENGQAWRRYLMLDETRQAFAQADPCQDQRRRVARQVLRRLVTGAHTEQQRQIARQTLGSDLIKELSAVSSSGISVGEMLHAAEAFEAQPISLRESRFADHYQSLLFGDDPAFTRFASLLETHYRNANIRLTVSQDLINALMPEIDEQPLSVDQQVFGARVRGHGRVTSRFQVQLVPDPQQWHVRFQTLGAVRARTVAQQSGVALNQVGTARFSADKTILVNRSGVHLNATRVEANSSQRLVNIHSDYDGIPLMGWLVRRIAQNQHAEKAPAAKRYVETELRRTTQSRVDEQLHQHLAAAQMELQEKLLGPLTSLELEPEPIQLSTTHEQLIMRYRIAGLDQMAAYSPRPLAAEGNLMCIQLHQSAINNLLAKCPLDGQTYTLDQFREMLGKLDSLSRSSSVARPDSDHVIEFTFAPRDSVRIDLDDDHVQFTLRLTQLRVNQGKRLRNLTVTARYELLPAEDRLFLQVDGDGVVVRGRGLNLGDQLVARTIFNELFRPQFELDVVPDRIRRATELNRVVMSHAGTQNGWLAIAISQSQSHPSPTVRHAAR